MTMDSVFAAGKHLFFTVGFFRQLFAALCNIEFTCLSIELYTLTASRFGS